MRIIKLERLDKEILLAYVLNVPRTYLHAWPERTVTEAEKAQFNALVKRRLQGEPLAYIVGYKEFWSLNFKVTKDVLIPRPETEILVQTVLDFFPFPDPNSNPNLDLNANLYSTESKVDNIQILELGTGSGAIAIALGSMRANWEIVAVDKSYAALTIAKQNAENLQVNNVKFLQSDWFSFLEEKASPNKFHAIVANPPYLSPDDPHLIYNNGVYEEDGDAAASISFEPREALVSEPDGLGAYRVIIPNAFKYLASKAWLFLEHGYDQGPAITDLMRIHGYIDIETRRDLAGLERVTIGRKAE